MRSAFREWPILMRDQPEGCGEPPEVSFVIGHRGMDRLPHLLATLRSIAGQQGASIECVVVEQDTAPRVQTELPPWVRYVFISSTTRYNRAASLNKGVSVASAPVVILHDNDMIVPAGYGAECVARCRAGYDFVEIKRFIFYLSELSTRDTLETGYPRSRSSCVVVENARGGSIAARRASYLSVGGFDEGFVGWGGEDNEFWERAEATGSTYRFGYLPLVHLYHSPQQGKGDPNSPSVRRYFALREIPPKERIEKLKQCPAKPPEP